VKIWFYQRDGTLISACHPKLYMNRFSIFMKSEVIIDQLVKKDEPEKDNARKSFMKQESERP